MVRTAIFRGDSDMVMLIHWLAKSGHYSQRPIAPTRRARAAGSYLVFQGDRTDTRHPSSLLTVPIIDLPAFVQLEVIITYWDRLLVLDLKPIWPMMEEGGVVVVRCGE
jgi:hypothetical protein